MASQIQGSVNKEKIAIVKAQGTSNINMRTKMIDKILIYQKFTLRYSLPVLHT